MRNRAVGRASGTQVAKRGWLGKRAWQDVRRASSIAVADGAYSCEIHGVRIVYTGARKVLRDQCWQPATI